MSKGTVIWGTSKQEMGPPSEAEIDVTMNMINQKAAKEQAFSMCVSASMGKWLSNNLENAVIKAVIDSGDHGRYNSVVVAIGIDEAAVNKHIRTT